MNRPSRPGPSEKLVTAIGETQRTLAVATASALVQGGLRKARFAGFAAHLGTAKQGKVTDAAPDRDPIGLVSDVSDGVAVRRRVGDLSLLCCLEVRGESREPLLADRKS